MSASFAAAGIGAASFGAVAVSSLGDIFEASKEVEKIEEKLAKADSAKEKIAAQKELAALYADMSTAQQGALKDLQKFKDFWSGFTKKFEEPVFKSFSAGLQITQKILNGLEPTIKKVSGVVVELMQGFNKSIDGGGLKDFFTWLETYAAKSLKNLLTITGNTFAAVFNLFRAFAPLGSSIENGLVGMTQRFKQWSASLSGSKGFQSFIEYAKTNGPVLLDILGNVWSVVVDVVKALAPLGSTLLNVFNKLTSVLAELTPWFGVLTDKVAEFASNILGKLGPAQEVINGISSAFKAISEIFKNGLKGYGGARNLLEEAGFSENQIQQVIRFSYALKGAFDKVKSVFSGIGTLVTGGGSLNLMTALGFSPEMAAKVDEQINGIVTKISEFITNVKTKFGEVGAYISEKITQLAPTFETLKEAFSTAWNTVVSILTNAWIIIESILSTLWNWIQIIGDVAVIVFNNIISPAISFLVQLFSTLWAIAQPILAGLAIAFETLSAVIKWLWDNILAPLVDFITTAVKNAFDIFSGALETVQGWFETLSGWISTAYGYVKDFIDYIGKVKLPDWLTGGISTGVKFVGNLIGVGGDKGGNPKSHYSGLDSVPYDGYTARLHKSEKVLTAREAKEYDEGLSGGGITIAKLADQIIVREDADIEDIAYKLARMIERERSQVS
ncbi:hypothetical protein [Lysinibacillus sp. fls2-241-R2A-57]|uniref:phage tail protein n=1 Tax=Lysinibacillus sp. fls2-241-R2A-57 TaxID=3040292 RepID=UPI002553D213|nr:hypothetical protein [Lysinibacillus sp. fls2-241-R2A-57]